MEGHPYAEKHAAILDMLKDKSDKSAHFICAMSIIIGQNEYRIQGRVDGKIVSPEIDDMYPFLGREEYIANRIKD